MARWIKFFSSRTVWTAVAAIAGGVCIDVFELNIEQDTIDKGVLAAGGIVLWLIVGDIKGMVADLKAKK